MKLYRRQLPCLMNRRIEPTVAVADDDAVFPTFR